MRGNLADALCDNQSLDATRPAASHAVNVLIIDDNPADLDLAAESLAGGTGPLYRVECARSLSTGLERLSSGGIDVVLLELQLPDSAGLDTLEKVRSHSPDLPILVLTGRPDRAFGLSAVLAGAQDYLMKDEMNYLSLTRVIQYAIARERASRSKDDFVGVVCHEIRNPLAVIQTSIEILRGSLNGGMTAHQEKFAGMASRNAEFLTKIIENMLNLARLESGKAKIRQAPLNVAELISTVLQNFQATAHERGLVLQSDILKDLPDVLADTELLQQVLNNLMDNAVRFARQKVMVRAEISPTPAPGFVQISVVDDGPGIPPSQTGRIFNKFVQLKRPEGLATYKGTGLGLAICKQIIDLHGGKIRVDNVPGRGANFSFVLPVAPRSTAD